MIKPSIHERRKAGKSSLERRAVVRYSCFAKALGEYPAGDTTRFFEGRIIALSVNGVGLRIRQKLATGTMVSLILEHAIGIFQCERSAQLVHARRQRDSWVIGCEFTDPLTVAELRRFHVGVPAK